MTHGQVAAKVRKHKENNSELYCAVRGCLWRIVRPKQVIQGDGSYSVNS